MTENRGNNQIVSFRLTRSTDGTFKITKIEAMNRTKRMVAFDKGLRVSKITVRQNLKEDLNYSDRDKKDLKGFIDNVFFKDVDAVSDINDLVQATTVGDLFTRIFRKYIPEGNKQ